MSENWALVKISDCFQVNPQRQIKRGTIAPYVPMEALPINGRKFSNIYEREFKGSGQKFINGDTLIARITPCLENGKTAYVTDLQKGAIGYGSTEYIILRGIEGKTNNLFAYYLARTPTFRHYAIGRMEGTSGRQRVPATAVETYEMLLPPLDEQKAIASVLGALDEKIEKNQQINETLEGMARAIFKSWFVDFDPVHAKAASNAPAHMDAETAALFPSSFGDDGLPVGWQKVYLKDLTNIVYGKNLPTKKLLTSGYPVFGGNGVIGFFSEYLYEKPQVLVACRGAASGKVIRSLPFSFVTNNSLVIEITAPYLNRFFLELYLRDLTLEGFTTGSAQPQMTIANMDAVKLLNPTKEVLHRFQMEAEPVFDKILANDTENQVLADLRDTFLPKFMSGEIRVKDAEREVEAAI